MSYYDRKYAGRVKAFEDGLRRAGCVVTKRHETGTWRSSLVKIGNSALTHTLVTTLLLEAKWVSQAPEFWPTTKPDMMSLGYRDNSNWIDMASERAYYFAASDKDEDCMSCIEISDADKVAIITYGAP